MSWSPRLAIVLGVLACASASTPTLQEERLLGVREEHTVRQSYVMIRDRVITRYVSDLGRKLAARAAPSPFELRFFVIEDAIPGAFALPGGAIYVSTGLILEARDASELAGVLTHMIAHVALRHVGPQYQRAGQRSGSFSIPFPPASEREADALAREALARAGYDASGLARIVARLAPRPATRARALENRVPAFLDAHPSAANDAGDAGATPDGLSRDDDETLRTVQERIRLIIGPSGS
jgi:predicted Zn-dependent protease